MCKYERRCALNTYVMTSCQGNVETGGGESQTGNSFQWHDSASWNQPVGKYVTRFSTPGWLRFLEVRYTTELLKPRSQLGPCALSQQNLRTFEGKYPAAHPGCIPSSPGACGMRLCVAEGSEPPTGHCELCRCITRLGAVLLAT